MIQPTLILCPFLPSLLPLLSCSCYCCPSFLLSYSPLPAWFPCAWLHLPSCSPYPPASLMLLLPLPSCSSSPSFFFYPLTLPALLLARPCYSPIPFHPSFFIFYGLLLAQSKCEQYWPDSIDQPVNLKDMFILRLSSVPHFSDYIMRRMELAEVCT